MARVGIEFAGNERDAIRATDRLQRAFRDVEQEARRTSQRSSAELRGLEQSVNRTASGIERNLLGATRRAALGVGVAVGTASTAVGYLGLSFYRTQQSAQIAFKTMLGDGGRAKRFLDDLAKFAQRTPFEFPDLIRATQRMMAMGFEAKRVVPLLTDVGNAAAAMGGDPMLIEQTVRALGQVQSRGRLMAEEMNQFIDAGTFGWTQLAAAIGTSVPQAMELVRKGAVDADTAIAAFQQSSQRSFQGMMDEQSRSFTGLLSTLKDGISQASATSLTPFFELVERGMARVNDELASQEGQRGVERLARFVETGVVPALQRAVDWVVRNREEITAFARDGGQALAGLVGALRDLSGGLRTVAGLVGGWDKLFELLLLGRLLIAVRNLTLGFTALAGTSAAAGAATGIGGAAAAAGRLRATLLLLSRMAPIAIPITLLIYRKEIEGGIGDLNRWINRQERLRDALTTIGLWNEDTTGMLDPSTVRRGRGDRTSPQQERARSSARGGAGIQVPTQHSRAPHPTAGLPGYPAVDYFAKPGTPVRAPENGAIVRHSGRGGTSGQVYGVSLYYDGYETGNGYFITHLSWVAPIGRYRKGDEIGRVSPWSGGAPHAHVGIRPGGARGAPTPDLPPDLSVPDLPASTTVASRAQTAAQQRREQAAKRLTAARPLRASFMRLRDAFLENADDYDADSRSAIARLVRSGNETIRKAFKDGLITERELGAVKKAFDRLSDEMQKGVDRAQDRFDRAWDRFRSLVNRALSNVGPEATLERRRRMLVESDATAIVQQILGGGDATDEERRVQAAAERVQAAWKAYSEALKSGDRAAVATAAAQLVEAQRRFEQLGDTALADRAKQLYDAYSEIIGVMSERERELWETMTDEQQDAIGELLDKLGEKLRAGKITYAEARRLLRDELAKLGVDVENIGGLLGEPFQQAMIRALNGIEDAVRRLVAALRGVGEATAALPQDVSLPTRGRTRRPEEEDGGGGFFSTGGPFRPISAAPVTVTPVRITGGGGRSRPQIVQPQIVLQPQITFAGPFMGDEREAREFARQVIDPIRSEAVSLARRIGGSGRLFNTSGKFAAE